MALTNGLQLLYGIQPLNALPVDAWSGPYDGVTEAAAIAAANAAIPAGARFVSLGVRLIISGVPKWYWYRDGISNSDLVEYYSKTDPSTFSYLNTQFFKITGDIVTGDTLFTKNVTISGSLSSTSTAYFNDAFFQSATAVALSGVFYGDGRRLLGSAFDQDEVNAWVRSNSSVAIGFNTLSAKNIYGDFLGSEIFKTNNATEITTNTAQNSATFHGVFYGDGRRLLGSAFDQDEVNAWVRSNSSVAIGFNTLSAKNIYGDFLGSEIFKTNNATEIATNTAQSSATFHGVFYGDGRRLLGSAFDQDSVNSWVRSNSSVATGFDTLSSKTINGDFLGTTLFKTQSATTITTNTAAGSSTFHGVYYGNGEFLDNVTVGNRRFEYIPSIGSTPAYSYSGTTRSVYTTPGNSLWKIVKMEYDTDGTVLGLSAAVNVTWTGRAGHTYSL
jgi:hypothetical protein